MSPPSIIGFGVFLFILFAGCQAQAPLQFKSFSEIPQALLDQLSSSQIQNIKNALSGGGGGGSPETFQIGGGNSGEDESTGGQNDSGEGSSEEESYTYSYVGSSETQSGTGSPGGQSPGGNSAPQQKTFQFSSFSQIPQSLLDMLPPDQVENLRNSIPATGKMPSQQQPQPPASSSNGGAPPGAQTFHFNSFSEIPKSLLDKLSSDQVQNLRNQIPAHGFVPSQKPNGGIPSSPQEQPSSSASIPTFKGSPGDNLQPGRTLQFSKYSDIPNSVLEKLSSDQKERIKKLLTQQNQPVQVTSKPSTSQPSQQTFEFSSFSQIPDSILSQFSSDQIRQIKDTLQNQQGVVQLPGKPSNQFEFTFPQGTSKRENDFLNIVFNYVAAGGYLTGIPPVDLLLIRFYIQMGPKNYC